MKIWVGVAPLAFSACVLIGADDEPPRGSTGGSDESVGTSGGLEDDESSDSGGVADETGDLACEPDSEASCADVRAPALRGLENSEWFGLSTRDGTTDLVFDETLVHRRAPQPQHAGYVLVFLPGYEGQIQAGLSPETHAELSSLIDAGPTTVGPHGYARDATLRIDDRQVCVERDAACEAFDSLVDFASDLDTTLLDAWRAQDSGSLHVLDEIVVEPWPLDVAWGEGGDIEISEDDFESLEGSWFSDVRGRTAHVGRVCYGNSDGCHTWIIEVELVPLDTSELSDDQHRALLEGVGLGWLGFGIQLEGSDFDAVRDTQLLTFADPDDAAVERTLAVVAQPSLTVDISL
ncbi:MAG: hypothetical protein AAF721_15165 [Myxococcota bacterium]